MDITDAERIKEQVIDAVQSAINAAASTIADEHQMDYEDALELAINALANIYGATDDDALDAITNYTREG